MSRVEERETLHNLNSRLQYFLMRMKELEANNADLQSKLDADTSATKAQTDQMRSVYERQLSELRLAQEKDVELIAELKAKVATLQAQAADATKQANANRRKADRCDDLEAKLRAATDERDRAVVAARDAQAAADGHKEAAAVAEAKASVLEKKLAPLREQLSTVEELRRKESVAFRQQLEEATTGARGELDRLKAHYEAQMQTALDECKTRADEERKAEVEQLAAHFSAVEAELSREVAEEKGAKESALKRASELTASQSDLHSRVNEAEARAAALERQAADRSRSHEKTVADLDSLLAAARQARKEKETEFNELMDVKISLDEELKTYRSLIEREEERLGITPTKDVPGTGRKRRRAALTGPAPYISELHLGNDCFTVSNAGDEALGMGGYKVRSVHSEEVVYEFPEEFELLPGSQVTVWSGKKNQRKKRDPRTELWWSPRYMWNDAGDTAILTDPLGAQVSTLDAPANGVGTAEDPTLPVEDEGAAGGAASQCAVM